MEKGFSFVELLVVITIIAVMMGIGAVSYQTTGRNSRDTRRKSDIEVIKSALEIYRAEVGQYPTLNTDINNKITSTSITDGVNTYLDPIPADPDEDTDYFYTYDRTSASSYTLCASALENGGNYCVANP
ncbi:type II secretion system protein GspG [Candidatus Collierbacteria bacterium]|nr:type II secretion system protein GspG [Candidatus Collierbacteria bacterium]